MNLIVLFVTWVAIEKNAHWKTSCKRSNNKMISKCYDNREFCLQCKLGRRKHLKNDVHWTTSLGLTTGLWICNAIQHLCEPQIHPKCPKEWFNKTKWKETLKINSFRSESWCSCKVWITCFHLDNHATSSNYLSADLENLFDITNS